jgi:hypothetical protein
MRANIGQILRVLLNYPGIQIVVENRTDQNTPFHYFCALWRSENCQELGKLLISRGNIDVNRRNRYGEVFSSF